MSETKSKPSQNSSPESSPIEKVDGVKYGPCKFGPDHHSSFMKDFPDGRLLCSACVGQDVIIWQRWDGRQWVGFGMKDFRESPLGSYYLRRVEFDLEALKVIRYNEAG